MKTVVHFYKAIDLENIRSFYGEILGLTLFKDQTQCLIYDLNSHGHIGFCTHHPLEKRLSTCITFVYDTVDEVDNKCHYLNARGVICSTPSINEKFKIYHFFTKDYEDNTLEFQCFLSTLD